MELTQCVKISVVQWYVFSIMLGEAREKIITLLN